MIYLYNHICEFFSFHNSSKKLIWQHLKQYYFCLRKKSLYNGLDFITSANSNFTTFCKVCWNFMGDLGLHCLWQNPGNWYYSAVWKITENLVDFKQFVQLNFVYMFNFMKYRWCPSLQTLRCFRSLDLVPQTTKQSTNTSLACCLRVNFQTLES